MPKPLLNLSWQTLLADYVTALDWFPNGSRLAAGSAAGEVVLFDAKSGASVTLREKQGSSVDARSQSRRTAGFWQRRGRMAPYRFGGWMQTLLNG